MAIFRTLLLALWIFLWILVIRACIDLGLGASWVFVTDFAHPWRAMLNSDFSVHLLLIAAWIVYRERSPVVGVVCALLALLLGMPFTLMYILVTTYREGGDMRRVLLGRHFSGPLQGTG